MKKLKMWKMLESLLDLWSQIPVRISRGEEKIQRSYGAKAEDRFRDFHIYAGKRTYFVKLGKPTGGPT